MLSPLCTAKHPLSTLVFAGEGSRIKRHWIRWEWPSSGAAPRTPSADVPSRPVLREVAWAAGSPPEMDGPLLHVAAALPWGGGADPRSRLEWRGGAGARGEGTLRATGGGAGGPGRGWGPGGKGGGAPAPPLVSKG